VLTRIFKTQDYRAMADYQIIVDHIASYQKTGENRRWDDYGHKIPDALRSIWRLILNECARNGFIAPYVYDGELHWRRIMTHGKHTDLCSLCRRECIKRDDIDNGETKWRRMNVPNYHEPTKCWVR